MAWLLLVVAGGFETAFAVALKQSHGFTRLVPTVLFVVFALISFGLLSLATQPAGRHRVRGLDRDRGGRDGAGRDPVPG